MVAEPRPAFEQNGWQGQHTATGDPRVPERCDWCMGAKVLMETMDLLAPWDLIPVRCRRCDGQGEYRRERRRR